MWVGALSYVDRYYQTARTMPVDPVQKVTPISGNVRHFQPAGNEGSAVLPIRSDTSENAMIYSSNRLRVNENTFDHAPLTKSAAHMRARARIAMRGKGSQALSVARQGAAVMNKTPKTAVKKEIKADEELKEKKLLPTDGENGFSVVKLADMVGSLGNNIDIYA